MWLVGGREEQFSEKGAWSLRDPKRYLPQVENDLLVLIQFVVVVFFVWLVGWFYF